MKTQAAGTWFAKSSRCDTLRKSEQLWNL